MKLYLRNNGTKDNWIDIDYEGDKFKLLIDYPTPEQEQRLQSILYGIDFLGEDRGIKYAQYVIRFVIKDWKNVIDENNNEVELILSNNMMDEKQWWSLVHDPIYAVGLFKIINNKIKLTNLDKKKLSTQQSLKMEEILKEEEKTTQSKGKDSITNT